MNRSNRSKHDKFSDILRAIDIDGVTINEILFKTYISYDPLKKYLTFLIQQGLIAYRKEEKRSRVTQLGFHALDMYAKMDKLLVRKTRYDITPKEISSQLKAKMKASIKPEQGTLWFR